MGNQQAEEAIKSATFGRRKVVPRVCVVDGKPHVRKFIGEALENSDLSPASAPKLVS
jgi:hypothetical protein